MARHVDVLEHRALQPTQREREAGVSRAVELLAGALAALAGPALPASLPPLPPRRPRRQGAVSAN